MKVYKDIKSLVNNIDRIKARQKSIGFVPTMGFLHEGHLGLIRKARKDTDCVIVSIFVNPIQFGPREDFKKYPRDLKTDLGLCKISGANIIFVPEAKTMFEHGFCTYVNVENLTDVLCGGARPGHFKGVTTVVAKLFNIIKPDIAYFGQKDAQQSIVIKRMVKDLNMPIKIKIMPIVREKDGLAMSSRNIYLGPKGHRQALSLYRALCFARDLVRKGERAPKKIIGKMRDIILQEKGVKIDYVSIVDTETLKAVDVISGKVLVALAVWVGSTRLIDNIILSPISRCSKSNLRGDK